MASARTSTPRVGVRTRARTPVIQEIVPNSGWTEDSAGHYLLVDLPDKNLDRLINIGRSDVLTCAMVTAEDPNALYNSQKEEVKLQVDSNGRIIVKGEMQASEQKRVRFQLGFPVPVNSDVDKIAGKFDSGILYVTVPKIIAQENKESETEKAGNDNVERAEENDSHETNADDGVTDPIPSPHVIHTEKEEKRNENNHIGEFSEQVIKKWEQESMLRSAVEVLSKNKAIVITAVIAFSLGLFVSRKFQFSEAP